MTDTALTTIGPLQRQLAVATAEGDIAGLRDVAAMATALQKGARVRGMGIETENQAAEVILRSERALGELLISLEPDLQRAGSRIGGAKRHGLSASADDLLTLERVSGITAYQRDTWPKLARITEDKFEELLVTARMANERMAKVDFYKRAPRVDQREHAKAQENDRRVDPALTMLKTAINEIIGWTVAENGEGFATENRLLGWPVDHLIEMAELIQRLAEAYRKAREARQ